MIISSTNCPPIAHPLPWLQAAQQSQSGKQPIQQGRIAVKCMAALLVSLPHFNYTSDLLAALVPYMAHRDQQMRWVCGCEGCGGSHLVGWNQGFGEHVSSCCSVCRLAWLLGCVVLAWLFAHSHSSIGLHPLATRS